MLHPWCHHMLDNGCSLGTGIYRVDFHSCLSQSPFVGLWASAHLHFLSLLSCEQVFLKTLCATVWQERLQRSVLHTLTHDFVVLAEPLDLNDEWGKAGLGDISSCNVAPFCRDNQLLVISYVAYIRAILVCHNYKLGEHIL